MFAELSPRIRFTISTAGVVSLAVVTIWLTTFLGLGLDLVSQFVIVAIAFIVTGVIWDRIFLHGKAI